MNLAKKNCDGDTSLAQGLAVMSLWCWRASSHPGAEPVGIWALETQWVSEARLQPFSISELVKCKIKMAPESKWTNFLHGQRPCLNSAEIELKDMADVFVIRAASDRNAPFYQL